MKKVLRNLLNYLLIIISLPIFMLVSPLIWWRWITDQNIRLDKFLLFGRAVIGGYGRGKLRVGTNINNVIYQNDEYMGWKDYENLKYLYKMKVYNYWVEDDYLFIKVFKNDKLIAKHEALNDRKI